MKGETLEKELENRGVFNESKIRELLIDLLSVLQFVHSHNVIHRDIKPENIIRREADKRLVLVDFGAAKVLPKTQRRTVTGTVIGSAEYCAPEQSMGKAKSGSDLYSLGVVCLHLGFTINERRSNLRYNKRDYFSRGASHKIITFPSPLTTTVLFSEIVARQL
ncbi:MAG: protein kinase [Okeania sp. SIO3I5]|nr:protein kinase [Okeania sp. SIO3I5]